MKRTITAVATIVTLLVPAGSVWGQEADTGSLDTLEAVLADVAEALTGVDVRDLGGVALLEDIVATANFVVAVQRADRNDLELDAETATVEAKNHGEIVSTVAHCAPRGQDAKNFFSSMKNHGKFVTVAAQGGVIDVDVPVIAGEGLDATVNGTQTMSIDLSTLEGAQLLCRATALVQQAADLGQMDPKAERKADRDAAKADRDAAKGERQATADNGAKEKGNADRGSKGKGSKGKGSKGKAGPSDDASDE